MTDSIGETKYSIADRESFLDELAHVAKSHSISLDLDSEIDQDEHTTNLLSRIQEMKEEMTSDNTVRFSPVLQVFPLKKKMFSEIGLTLQPFLNQLMRRYDFYYVKIPITIFPKGGWVFEHLECRISMNPNRPASERPLAYQIFPNSQWETVVQAKQELSVGLDENFSFRTPKLPLEIVTQGAVSADIQLDTNAGARFLLGPFNYIVRRPKIQTAGIGDVEVIWRLEGEEYFQEEPVNLGLVIQVPQGTERVDIAGVLEANKNFQKLTTDIKKLMRFLRQRTQNFFKQGAPIQRDHPWEDILAGL